MKIPLQITFKNIQNSEAVEKYIHEKAQKLNEFFADIVSCRVVVEMPHKHHNQGNQFIVSIDLGVPSHEIVVNKDHHEDVYIALREAFDAVKRQLKDYVHQLRNEVKNHVPEYIGHVSRIFRKEGFGFIMGEDGTEYYFNRDNIVSSNFEHLNPGDEVKFIEETSAERPQAKRISIGYHKLPS
jgi:ribosomal subunit interface protein